MYYNYSQTLVPYYVAPSARMTPVVNEFQLDLHAYSFSYSSFYLFNFSCAYVLTFIL